MAVGFEGSAGKLETTEDPDDKNSETPVEEKSVAEASEEGVSDGHGI